MGSRNSNPKESTQREKRTLRPAEVPPIIHVFMMAAGMKMRPLLRPSARRDMGRYMGRVRTEDEAKIFLEWSIRVLNAHHEDTKSMRGGRARLAILQTELPIFRKPQRAYRIRWML
jgi:hypothetical protein